MSGVLEPPRWPNGPKICAITNLPAYVSLADAKKRTGTVEGDSIKDWWTCGACGLVHCEHTIRPPAGATSGSGREPCEQRSTNAAKRLKTRQSDA